MTTSANTDSASLADRTQTEQTPAEEPQLKNIDLPTSAASPLQEIREAVYRLLKYAVSDANRNVDPQIINDAIPVLQKNAAQFTAEDEKNLWSIYNQLSHLVTPATNESLWLKEQMEQDDRAQAQGNSGDYSFTAIAYKKTYTSFKWIGYVFGIIFFLLQSYTVMLSDSLEQVDRYYAELTKIEIQQLAAQQANPAIAVCALPLKALTAQKEQIELKIDRHYQVMQRLSRFFWGYFYATDTLNYYNHKPPQCSTPPAETTSLNSKQATDLSWRNQEQQASAERSTFFEGARSTLRLCNYLILPLILGTLGSVAYVIRSILDSFARASLTFDAKRRGSMRVYLGALLGLISGIIIVPNIKEIQEISYSPLVRAFLMGYSVEFAFTFFDALIARGRTALEALKTPPNAVKEGTTEAEDKKPAKK